MGSTRYMDNVHNQSVDDNPYYLYFKNIHGSGGGIGEVYTSEPDFQRGYGITYRNDHNESRAQLGSGFRSWIGNVFQFAKPYLKRGIKAALNFGTKIVHDIIDGESPTTAVKKRVKEVAKSSLPPPVSDFIHKTVGSGSRRKRVRTVKLKIKRKPRKNKKRYSALDLIPE
jgi:hypothetical protein